MGNESGKDVVFTGLHNLTEGEKTPLTDYNKAIQHLQCRRGIMSVAEQVKHMSLQLLSQPTATMGAGPASTTIDPPIETLPTPMVSMTEGYESMSMDENEEDEYPTEFGKILNEPGNKDTTLLRLSEEDVALDMDEVVMEVEEQEELSDDDDEDSEESPLAED